MGANGYQPETGGSLDKKNPPQQGSAFVVRGIPTITHTGQAQRCPMCNGCGQVDSGFYTQTSGNWSFGGGTEDCRSCKGKGYVVV